MMKRLKFDHTDKLYMHKLKSIQENETHKYPWDFEINMDHLISVKRSELVLNNKENNSYRVPADHKVKIKENENIEG